MMEARRVLYYNGCILHDRYVKGWMIVNFDVAIIVAMNRKACRMPTGAGQLVELERIN